MSSEIFYEKHVLVNVCWSYFGHTCHVELERNFNFHYNVTLMYEVIKLQMGHSTIITLLIGIQLSLIY